jgi:DNA-binding phage protein
MRETRRYEEHLYRRLSEKGNPELRSLESLLDALGLHASRVGSSRRP